MEHRLAAVNTYFSQRQGALVHNSSSRSRATAITFLVGALVALSALAAPTAASAVETCTTTTTPTAQTQPWQDFATAGNPLGPVEAAFAPFVDSSLELFGTVDADFTQAELDGLTTSITNLWGVAGTAITEGFATFGDQRSDLAGALLVADPANEATWTAIMDGFNDQLTASQYGAPLNEAYGLFISGVGDYLSDIQDAITAVAPVPTTPPALTASGSALIVAVDGLADFFQLVYDGAAAQVVFTQSCVQTLAATGPSDQPRLITGAAGLLLLGVTAVAVAATRRREVTAN